MEIHPEQIPADLRTLARWVLWRYEERDGKPTKVPYSAVTGGRASTTDSRTWANFRSVWATYQNGGAWSGIGFVFAAEDDLLGVDLDHCRDPVSGEIEEWAAKIVTELASYTEVTPSQTGLHILCRGKLPAGRRRQGRFEIYEEGRYFTVTGSPLAGYEREIETRDTELTAVLERLLQVPRKPVPVAPGQATARPDQGSVIEKVLRHPKGRSLWGGDISGYPSHSEADAALCEIIAWFAGPDEALIDQIFRQSSLYRPERWDRTGDSYSERTLRFVLADKGPHDFYSWEGTNSFNSLNSSPVPRKEARTNSFNSLNSSAVEDESLWPGDLEAEAFHGPAGEIVQALAPETEADPAALLLNLLIAFGNAVGRGPWCKVGATRHGTNLFGVLVGYTGDARKGTSWDPVKDLFERALPTYMQQNRHGGIASGEGLLALVRDRQEKRVQIKDKKSGRMTMEFETVVEDEGVADKRALVIETEMSSLWKIMTRPGNILAEQYQKAWDSGDLQNQNKNSPMRATGAHISVLGHSTPAVLQRLLTEVEAASGFGNRFLYLLCKRARLLPEGGELPSLNSYVSDIKILVELASDKIMMPRDTNARRVWAAVYPLLTQAGVGMFGEMTARRAPIVMRLSMIYALWDGVSVVSTPHLLAALALWERAEASVRYLFGDATGDPAADALLEAMQARPEGASRTDLHNALGRNRPVAEIDRGLTALLRAGKAASHQQKEGRHVTEIWNALAGGQSAPGAGRYLSVARAVVPE